MLGNDKNYGITYLTMKDLYEKVNEQQDSKKFEIYVSYLEVIYANILYFLNWFKYNLIICNLGIQWNGVWFVD